MNRAEVQENRSAGARILVIDDDEGMGYTLTRMAEEEGHVAVAALTLAEGLERVRGGGYDVVFLDVRLPDGSGIEAIPHIQATAAPPEIIIITGYGDKDGAKTALKNGVWDYIEKPGAHQRPAPVTEKGPAVPSAAQPPARPPVLRPQRHHRRQHPAADVPDRHGPRRPERRQRADQRRDRHRQGALRPGHPPQQRPCAEALRGGGLRLAAPQPDRKYPLRPPQGVFHRRRQGQRWAGPHGGRRHAVSRRGGRTAAFLAEDLPARAPGKTVPAGGGPRRR